LLAASRAHDESDRDIGRRRELQSGGAQIDAVAGCYRSKLLPLFDHGRGNLEVLFAVVVTRATRDEPGIERRADDQRNILLAHGREEFVHGAGVIDQRILPGAQTDIGIGILHDLEDGQPV